MKPTRFSRANCSRHRQRQSLPGPRKRAPRTRAGAFRRVPRSVPKLGRARSEKKSATCPAAGTSQIGRTLTLRPRSGTDGLAPSPQLGGACKDFPARRDELPAPAHRELAATAVKRRRNFGSVSSRRVRYRRDSLYFPCRSGIWPQRRVRYRLVPPPFSLRVQRLPARTGAQPEKSPRFRGVLAVEPSRIRTGDCGFWAGKTPRPVFVSVAKLGGSVSLRTRVPRARTRMFPVYRAEREVSR